MANPKEILVVTTSTIDGIKIIKHLKPVTAHVVAGTNFFSDFMGGFSDVFGGRSQTYQKQLTSIYNEAIEKIKLAAHEIGGNCIIGLSIDLDEISGKGKSMFMITAIGTAVIIEKEKSTSESRRIDAFSENIPAERINTLRTKREIIERAQDETLVMNDDVWSFIINNQVGELFSYIIKRYADVFMNGQILGETYTIINRQFLTYIEALEEQEKIDLLYDHIKIEQNESLINYLSKIIKDLNLYNYNKVMELLNDENFWTKKQGLKIATYDKSFYNLQDKEDLQTILSFSKKTFIEQGQRTTKKQMLSSKEKDVWSCACGKTNDLEQNCIGCGKDINGFKSHELKFVEAEKYLLNKIDLMSEYLK